jgi:hypothetical protein
MLVREGSAFLKRRGCLVQEDRETLCGLPRAVRCLSGGAVLLCRSDTTLARRDLALDGGLLPQTRRLLTPRARFSALHTLLVLTVLGLDDRRLTLIRMALALICGLFPGISDPVALSRDQIALIRDPLSLIGLSLAIVRRRRPRRHAALDHHEPPVLMT